MRDPYAKALRVKPQQVIPDKRDQARVAQAMDDLKRLYDDTLDQPIPEEMTELLKRLD